MEEDETRSASEESEASGSVVQFVPKRGSHSVVWQYFGFKPCDDDQCDVHCCICSAPVAAKKGNTTNLFNHLKRHHKVQYEQSVQNKTPENSCSKKQTSITDTIHNATPYPPSSRRQNEITTAIAYHLAKDMAPINTVEHAGLKQLIKTLDKRYSMPSRNYFSNVALPAMYGEKRAAVETELGEVDYYSVTSDLWSSRTMEPYLSLTVHFIATDFTMKNRCLQTAFFPEDHTGQAIAYGLKEALASWGLEEEKLACITTDNGQNIVKAVSINNWTRLQCFGHRLHLAIENAMKDSKVDRAVGLCKKIVGSFSHSWKRSRDLAEAQKELKLPMHKLKTECSTRWGSRQAMVQRILEQLPAISHVLSPDRKARHLIPMWQDVEVLEAINSTLTPLVDFTDALSGEQYVSISSVKPVLRLFETSVLAVVNDDTEFTKSLKSKILGYLQEKYSDSKTQDLLDMATTLDPRFKMSYIREEVKPTVRARLMDEMTGLNPAKQCAPSSAPEPPKKARKTLGSFFKAAKDREEESDPAVTHEQAALLELESYLLTRLIDSEDDPLTWWREHAGIYPRLSVLARKYLGIPATSSPSERLFSTGGNIVTCQRSSLKPQHVDRLVFLAKNL